ncbi:MAG: LacI family DNA-binding transcriptional regulator [Chloroflexota bacterium]|nr:LacI family DNA-binding transcriptional regulator [Chloroflexota bacterium]
MVTIKEVAEAAGVSIKTVSRVVNGHSEVADETRQRVQQVISDLGYQPNTMARSLVQGRSNTVGVVIPRSAGYIFSHPFFNEVLRGIAEVLGENNLNLLLHLAYHDTPYVQLYKQRRVDGLIFMSVSLGDPNLEGLLESEAPCVFTCRIAEQDNPTSWVDADFAGGVAKAAEHLFSLGHRRIGLLAGPTDLVSVLLRVKGYRQALQDNGVQVSEDWVLHGDFSSESGRALATTLMAQCHPSAIICGDDMMAIGAIQGLQELGYRVPDDVSVVGFDDVNMARFATPPLTTVRQDTHKKGRLAAKTLIEIINGSSDTTPTQIALETTLVVRQSTSRANK